MRAAAAAASRAVLALALLVSPGVAHAGDPEAREARSAARDESSSRGCGGAEPPDCNGDLSDEAILGESAKKAWLRVQSVMMRMTGMVQDGHGYQSKAGPLLGPGEERLVVFQPQIDITAQQGDRFTHRLWMPLDVVTAASTNAVDRGPDIMSKASKQNEAGTIDWTVTYKYDAETDIQIRNGVHVEEDFRGWHGGMNVIKGWDDRATTVTAGMLVGIDWFDRFTIQGYRRGRTTRTTTTASLGLTQILTPTTVANASYGLTVQAGELGTTWNSVPLDVGIRGSELLPVRRVRHALVTRLVQALPWNGALKGYYRFYTDDWSILAHTIEGQLLQRFTDAIYVAGYYRFHTQHGASFYTPRASLAMPLRTADSDLATLDAHAVGGRVVADFPLGAGIGAAIGGPKTLHVELGAERYWRDPDLSVGIFTCATGFSF